MLYFSVENNKKKLKIKMNLIRGIANKVTIKGVIVP